MEASMRWSRSEIDRLHPILEQISADLSPVDGKQILVLCSGMGEVAFWLAEMMETGKVVGLELDPDALTLARRSAHEMGLEQIVSFQVAEKDHIPFADRTFDALVSEFIVYPSEMPTEIGQLEMARVLKPGGKMIVTDVLLTQQLSTQVRQSFAAVGLDYLCEATINDFKSWMTQAGLINIKVLDLSATLRNAWEARQETDKLATHQPGYSNLLGYGNFGLGRAIQYIYLCSEKAKS
jgi:ubiquinone/menaquinone biosynthesis C-methylase UbiE